MASSLESRDEGWTKFKGRSKVWEHFEVNRDKSRAKCKICERTYVFCSATANFRNHLIKEHDIKLDEEKQSSSSGSGSTSHQPSIQACFLGAGKDTIQKCMARCAAKNRFTFRQIAESQDLR